MKRKIIMFLLGLGVLFGYGSAAAHLAWRHHGGHCDRDGGERILSHPMYVAARADLARAVAEEVRRTMPPPPPVPAAPIPPAPAAPGPSTIVLAVPSGFVATVPVVAPTVPAAAP
jgi:hypothetical protein